MLQCELPCACTLPPLFHERFLAHPAQVHELHHAPTCLGKGKGTSSSAASRCSSRILWL